MGLGALDPTRLLLRGIRLAGGLLPADLADRIAGLVRSVPPERLDDLMASPLRRPILDAVFAQIPRHLDAGRSRGADAAIRWRITRRGGGEDIYDLLVSEGRAQARRRGDDSPGPPLVITVDGAEFLRIAVGSSNPMNAYFAGKLSLRGDLMQAARLTMLFRIPSPPRASGGGAGRSARRSVD